MRHARTSVLGNLGKALSAHYQSIASEPLPERWVDLINYLNEKERTAQPPKIPATPKPSTRRSRLN